MSLIVKLNGSNYVSEKTKAAFTHALGSGRISESASQRVSESVNDEWRMASKSQITNQQIAEPAAPAMTMDYGLRPTAQNPKSKIPNLNLEQGLTHAYEQQQTTARVHEQYLSYQAEYATLYAQLLQQQGAIFGGVNGDTRKAELAAQVLETLAQSMARFHELQAETLNVHKQFLGQQADTSQTYMRLMVNGESGNGEWRMANEQIGKSQITNPQIAEPAAPADITHYAVRSTETIEREISKSANRQIADETAPADITHYALRSTDAPSASPSIPAINTAALQDTLLAIVSDKTGYPTEMLEPEMDMEADLGIDSIKRVEIMGALREAYPALPKTDPEVFAELRTLGQIIEYASERVTEKANERESESANGEWRMANDAAPADVTHYALRSTDAPSVSPATPTINTAALQETLLAIVSDKTGYPTEMLEPEMDMEADLGIDSIKRVEIMGALREAYPALPKTDPEVFAELRTLGQISEYANQQIGESANGEWRMTNDAAPADVTQYALRSTDFSKKG